MACRSPICKREKKRREPPNGRIRTRTSGHFELLHAEGKTRGGSVFFRPPSTRNLMEGVQKTPVPQAGEGCVLSQPSRRAWREVGRGRGCVVGRNGLCEASEAVPPTLHGI